MKSSRESGLDYSIHDSEEQRSVERGKEEKEEEEEGVGPDTLEEEVIAGQTAEEKAETTLDRYSPNKAETGPDPKSGAEGHGETELVFGGSGEPVSAEETSEALSSRVKQKTTGGDPAVDFKSGDYPDCFVAKTSQRCRPKLSRMERVQSSSSLTFSEEQRIGQTHRLVLR